MSIKLLAVELYRTQKEVWRLEKELEVAPLIKQDVLRQQLHEKKAEWQQLRKMLDGEKSSSSFRRRFSS
jgi:hypothetical protein